jgi:hypothetical protein
MATYVNDLRLKEIATGDESGTWGTSTNTNLELIAEAFSFGTEAITTNADTHTTTIADGSTDPGRSIYLKYTGTLDSACTITIGPNTVSKLWFIENGTSGSQNIIISQGSGANVTVPPGDTKAIYSDGAGSGAAMVDAFASLNVVDLKVEDDLTVTDDVSIGGALTLTGNGDFNGDLDVDGTTNLDVVDIDGAVDMASTLAVGGAVTVTQSSAATAATFKVGNNSAQVANVVVSNDADTGLNLGVFGSSAGTAGMISASDAFITTSTTELNVGVNNSSGVIKFGVGSTASEKMRIDGTGVGIGTTSPAATLDVTSSASDSVFLRSSQSTTTNVYITNTNATANNTANLYFAPANNISGALISTIAIEDFSSSANRTADLAFSTRKDGTMAERMRIDSSGNVGIGTTSPQKALDIAGASSGGGAVMRLSGTGEASQGDVTGAIQFHSADTTDNTPGVFGIIRGIAGASGGEGDIQILTDMPSEGADASTVAMHISSTAKVGINETSPDVTLHINSGTNDINTKFESTDTEVRIQLKDSTGTSYIAARNDIRFGNDTTTERMRINVNGHVLIGTTTNQGVGGISFQKGSTGVNIQQNMDGTSGGAELYVFRRNSTQIGSINQSSTNAVTYNTSSDARLKDVTGSARGLDVINNLNPVAYNWKADNHADEGLIAQEVEELVPNAVNQDEDGYYSMDYSKLVTHLVKGMQEQQKQIETLKSEIASLKEK